MSSASFLSNHKLSRMHQVGEWEQSRTDLSAVIVIFAVVFEASSDQVCIQRCYAVLIWFRVLQFFHFEWGFSVGHDNLLANH